MAIFDKVTHTNQSSGDQTFANGLENRIDAAFKKTELEFDNIREEKRIIDYGSNANGSWEKWSNGDLVQWGTFNTGNIVFDVLTSGLYPSKTYPYITMPIEFLDGNYRAFPNYGGAGFLTVSLYAKEKSRMRLKLASWGTSSFAADIDWLAIGKWK